MSPRRRSGSSTCSERLYAPIVRWVVANPRTTVGSVLVASAFCIPIASRLGAEFMPRLEEGDLLVEALRLPSASLEDSLTMSTQIEKTLLEFPEVKTVFCKTGRPEIANDVMGVHQTDVWVILAHKDKWRPGVTRDSLIEEMSENLTTRVPGVAFGFTQPIEMRVDELVAGVKADVACILYGDDINDMNRQIGRIESIIRASTARGRCQNGVSERLADSEYRTGSDRVGSLWPFDR
ncbi:MAG: efflux RND transporter permease subunit [Pirellulaceae bacterium]